MEGYGSRGTLAAAEQASDARARGREQGVIDALASVLRELGVDRENLTNVLSSDIALKVAALRAIAVAAEKRAEETAVKHEKYGSDDPDVVAAVIFSQRLEPGNDRGTVSTTAYGFGISEGVTGVMSIYIIDTFSLSRPLDAPWIQEHLSILGINATEDLCHAVVAEITKLCVAAEQTASGDQSA